MSGTDTRSRTPLWIVVALVAALMYGATEIGVDWGYWLDKGFSILGEDEGEGNRDNGNKPGDGRAKEVCLDVVALPAQRLHVSWHVGDADDNWHRKTETWDHCEPAKTGDTWYLLVEKSVVGNVSCAGTLMPEGTNLLAKAYGGSHNCRVSGVVP